jgi:hypothetical protein
MGHCTGSTGPMPTPRITEREAVLRERAAYVRGCGRGRLLYSLAGCDGISAREEYPLPEITRPRVVQHEGNYFRVEQGDALSHSRNGVYFGSLRTFKGITVDAALVRVLADLLANPTETVEDNG